MREVIISTLMGVVLRHEDTWPSSLSHCTQWLNTVFPFLELSACLLIVLIFANNYVHV